MGIRDFLRKRTPEEVVGTKILVASIDLGSSELMKADSSCYSQFYDPPTEAIFKSPEELLEAIGARYDVVHLFCDISVGGNITDGHGGETACARLIRSCTESNVKLLWLASENKPESFGTFKSAIDEPLNLVLTIDRKGS